MKHFVAFFLCGIFAFAAAAEDMTETLSRRLAEPGASATLGTTEGETASLLAVYRARGFNPLWIDRNGPTERAFEILDHLKRGRHKNGEMAAYRIQSIETLLEMGGGAALAKAELMLTSGVTRYVRGLRLVSVAGKKNPGKMPKAGWPPIESMIARLNAAPDLDTYLSSLESGSSRYRRLLAALWAYRAIAMGGGWERLPHGPSIAPGEADPRIPALRRRLAATGDYRGAPGKAHDYDAAVVRAVRRFQLRHGLAVDGIVGRATLAALNAPARRRVNQIILNLERRRWIPSDLGQRYVFVNIADAVVKYVEHERTLLDMRAVVGTPYRRTPVFKAEMTEVWFNPSWYVPSRIAREDLVPKIIRDPRYLSRGGYQVLSGGGPASRVVDPGAIDWSSYRETPFPYLLRQTPGRGNALGRIKFVLPNEHNVFLHDTPARGLLAKSSRAFSSGCIRLEKPLALSALLLRGQPGWSTSAIRKAIDSTKTISVRLATPVPVYLTYLTAWANKDGTVHFRDDIYGRDRRLAAKLALKE